MLSSKKITCKGTLRQVFIRVYRLETVSHFGIFRPSFVNCCPHLSGSILPPVPMSECSIYRKCGGGGCWVLLETIFCRSLTLCIWPDSEPTKFLDHSKEKRRREGVLRQINYLPWRHFALPSMSLFFLRLRCSRGEITRKSHGVGRKIV